MKYANLEGHFPLYVRPFAQYLVGSREKRWRWSSANTLLCLFGGLDIFEGFCVYVGLDIFVGLYIYLGLDIFVGLYIYVGLDIYV